MSYLDRSASFASIAWGDPSDTGVASILAVGTDGKIYASFDEEADYTFQPISNDAARYRVIRALNDTFYAAGDRGCFAIVDDFKPGSTTTISTPTSETIRDIAYDPAEDNILFVGDSGVAYYSTDDGSSWHNCNLGANVKLNACVSDGTSKLYIVGNSGYSAYSTNGGAAWTAGSVSGSDDLLDIDADGTNCLIVGEGGKIVVTNSTLGNESTVTSNVTSDLNACANMTVIVGNDGATFSTDLSTATAISGSPPVDFVDLAYDSDNGYLAVAEDRFLYYSESASAVPQWGKFLPVSDDYRANDYIVLNGYLILIGTSEVADDGLSYEYHSRRIRWTAPGTLTDFTGVGSGTGDLNGRGQLLFGEVVNNRGVIFESESISTLSYTGLVADPWNYEKIHEGLWSLSNPVVMNDQVYFVASDGLIYSTNAVSVSAMSTSFDLTHYTDWDYESGSTVSLGYSSEMQALLVFVSSSPYELHVISTSTGAYSTFTLPSFTVSSKSYTPRAMIPRNDNYLSTVMIAYGRNDGTGEADLLTLQFGLTSSVQGKDTLTVSGTTDTQYYNMVIDTGHVFTSQEGSKDSIKHVVIRTYADGTTTGYVGVQIKSLEDTEWHDLGEDRDTFYMDDTECETYETQQTNDPVTAVGNTITDGPASGEITLPCLAIQARLFLLNGSTYTAMVLGTDYTVASTNSVTLITNVPAGQSLVCYWENEPQIRVADGDFIVSDEGYHVVTDRPYYNKLTLDRYLSSGSQNDCYHVPGGTIPGSGEGAVKIGLNHLSEGVRLRVIAVPNGSSNSKVLKVTGLAAGFIGTAAQKQET